MGWWSTCVMGGDAPLDIQGALCAAIGIDFDFERGSYPYTAARLDAGLASIVKAIESTESWWSSDRDIAYQVLGHMILESGAGLPDALRERIVQATTNDDWAKEDPARRKSMDDFAAAVRAYVPGVPVHMHQDGLFEVIARSQNN